MDSNYLRLVRSSHLRKDNCGYEYHREEICTIQKLVYEHKIVLDGILIEGPAKVRFKERHRLSPSPPSVDSNCCPSHDGPEAGLQNSH